MEKSKSQLPEKNSDFIWVEAPGMDEISGYKDIRFLNDMFRTLAKFNKREIRKKDSSQNFQGARAKD